MRPARRRLRDLGLLAGALVLFAASEPAARAASTVTRDDIVNQLNRLDTALDLDVAALREQVLKRSQSRSRNEPPPQKRPPIAPELTKLPSFNVDIQFDTDTPIVRPESYQTLGRLADTLVNSALLNYTFLIVGHIESTGRRENNVLLSQRRADAVRDILINTFKISSKRLLDSARPNAPVNNQTQIMTLAKLPEPSEQPAAAAKKASPPKKTAKKR